MPSNSLAQWKLSRLKALDEIESAHAIIGGMARGRRHATQQINYSYAALLSSHFQGYCRDLHSECIEHLIAPIAIRFHAFLRSEFLWNRSLDKGNPHPGGIGSDFNRLGIAFWPAVNRTDARNIQRSQSLQDLNNWRNAIAHQDFTPVGGNSTLHLARVRKWRRAVAELAINFDLTMYNYLLTLHGQRPW